MTAPLTTRLRSASPESPPARDTRDEHPDTKRVIAAPGLVQVKALDVADGDPPGTFQAVVSVFGNVDSYGDRMVKGAFADTLRENPHPPVVWSHDWNDPPIGETLEATETDRGLEVKGRLFVGEGEDHPTARKVHVAMLRGALREFSFGFRITSYQWQEDDDEEDFPVFEITGVELYELGPCLVGANRETELIDVKRAGATAPATTDRRTEAANKAARDRLYDTTRAHMPPLPV